MVKKTVSTTQKMLNTWAIVLILWAIYRAYFKIDLPVWFDEFFAKPAIFLIPIFYFVTKIERQKFLPAVDFKRKNLGQSILFGLAAGSFFLVTGFIVNYMKNGEITFPNSIVSSKFIYIIIISLASSFSEEILSRGFILKRLHAESKSIVQSVFFASFLFFFLHIPILFTDSSLFGATLVQVMITDILLSFAVSLLYFQQKNVVVPIIVHAFYNISLYLFI